MTTVNPVMLCQECKYELPVPLPTQCPSCAATIRKPKNKYFSTPDYLHYQLQDHEEKLGFNHMKGPTDQQAEEMRAVLDNFISWIRECPYSDKINACRDVDIMFKEVLHSRPSGMELAEFVKLGKAIGQKADAIDTYVKSGGSINARQPNPIQTDGIDQGGDSPTAH